MPKHTASSIEPSANPEGKVAIQVGASPAAINAAKQAITEILTTEADTALRHQALATLKELCSVKNTTITGCQFDFSTGKLPDNFTVTKG